MGEFEDLYSGYLGDAPWDKFASCFGDQAIGNIVPYLDADMQKVLLYKLGNHEHLMVWLKQKIPALGGVSASEVLENHRNGTTIVRALIMRMP